MERKIPILLIDNIGCPAANWALVRNQLAMDDRMQARILRYEQY